MAEEEGGGKDEEYFDALADNEGLEEGEGWEESVPWEEEGEEEEHIRRWEEIPEDEQLALSTEFVELIMDIGMQNRILKFIEKGCRKKSELLGLRPTKCERREVRALQYCVKQERERKKKLLLHMKDFLAETPYGPWDFVTFTTRGLDTPQTDMCLSLNDYICTKLSEDPQQGVCEEKKQRFNFSDSFFTFS